MLPLPISDDETVIVDRLARSLFSLSLLAVFASAVQGGEREDFFERKIRPVLVKHCYECHSGNADVIQGDLRVDMRNAMLEGGDSGTAIVPGDPDASLLIASLEYDDLQMPPSGPLDEDVVSDFRRWIRNGAVDPRIVDPLTAEESPAEFDWETAREFWAFQSPQKHDAPSVRGPVKIAVKHDAFVVARLESAGLRPNESADKRSLIRRVTFDLTGLPPRPADVEAFAGDHRPDAYRRVVDRLLATTQHAERWTRLWLDVARYAEDQAHKVGNNDALTYPNAYYYRDWVIQAIGNDVPYDQFVRLQLASDLIDSNDTDSHLALGFLGLGPKYYRRNSPEVQADEWEDRVDTVTRGLLGLTVACARCHDHKFDPIPTKDYYALAGVFASTEMFNRPLDDDVEKKGDEAKDPKHAVHIVRDGKPRDLNVMIRGDASKQGPPAPRAFVQVLCSDDVPRLADRSGRLDLANAIVDSSNPLTARVMVNRVWRELMGGGLVETPSNFGSLGERPSHPELLDDLSVRFMENGWSLKWLQREIVLSSTYRQSSRIDQEKMAKDPANRLLWRMPRRRLSLEAYRDAVLDVSGRLDRVVGGKSMQPDDASSRRRTLYSEVSRMDLNRLLAQFDFPDPNAHSAKRVETITPLQKLFLLNSSFLDRNSDALAQQLEHQSGNLGLIIADLYGLLYGRSPTDDEVDWAETFISSGGEDSWTQYTQTLLIANEMFIID